MQQWMYANVSAMDPQGGAQAQWEQGTPFKVSAPGYVAGLRWWRADTTAGHKPSILRVWDTTAGTVIWQPATVPDNGAVGWQQVLCLESVPLLSNHEYRASWCFPAGGGYPVQAFSGLVIPSPFSWGLGHRCYHDPSGACGYPGTYDDANIVGADVLYSDVDPSAGGGPTPASTSDLASWLSSDGAIQTHEADGLPWLLKTEIAATKLLAQGALDSFKDADGNVRSIGDFAKEMTPTLVGIVKLFFNRADTQLTGSTAAGGTAFAALQDRMTDLENQLDGLADLVTRVPAQFPGAGWTFSDEVDFTWQKSWDVPADLYVLACAGFPSWVHAVDVDGAEWRPRAGWWAIRNGDHFGERRFVNWTNNHLSDGGRRMPGIVVRTWPDVVCTLQAWVLE